MSESDPTRPPCRSTLGSRAVACGRWGILGTAALLVVSELVAAIWPLTESMPYFLFAVFAPRYVVERFVLQTPAIWILSALLLLVYVAACHTATRRGRVGLTMASVIVAVTVLSPGWLSRGLFYAHLPALNSLADEVERSGSILEERRVGMYRFSSREECWDGVKLMLASDDGGHWFLFRQAREPGRGDEPTMINSRFEEQLTSRWWHWNED